MVCITGTAAELAQPHVEQSTVDIASITTKGANTTMVERAVALLGGQANKVAVVWHHTFALGEVIQTKTDASPHAPP